ncbi:hypothetical protein HII31_10544 [Pseudocercospora fuligena]|uniref:BTB domain-containing protein n=1 Tax=Pseudocercospora fuligena TaxID=685502 RepID=A0A8H6RCU9_9PEZI|nr:hypothetical protein HII31_10544 [Pseudocercospora fuligena]
MLSPSQAPPTIPSKSANSTSNCARKSDVGWRTSPPHTGQGDSREAAMEEIEKFTKKIEEERLILIKPANSEHTFKVSETLLCQSSDYFVKAVQGAFKEASTATLTLPGASLDTIQLFIYWLYH